MEHTKLTLRICGWSSILMGMVFLVYPEWYIELEGATTDNMAWLRNLGAALVAVNGVGALLAARDPQQERALYDVVMLASVLETVALGGQRQLGSSPQQRRYSSPGHSPLRS